jgi:hypothetical protein
MLRIESLDSKIATLRSETEIINRRFNIYKSLVSVLVNSDKGRSKSGTGFFVNDQGYIVTPHHVVRGAREIFVQRWHDSTEFLAMVVNYSTAQDLALLRVTAPKFSESYSSVVFADSTIELFIGKQVEIQCIGATTKLPVYIPGLITRVSKDSLEMSTETFRHLWMIGSPVLTRGVGTLIGMLSYDRTVSESAYGSRIDYPQYFGLISADRIKNFLKENEVACVAKPVQAFTSPRDIGIK